MVRSFYTNVNVHKHNSVIIHRRTVRIISMHPHTEVPMGFKPAGSFQGGNSVNPFQIPFIAGKLAKFLYDIHDFSMHFWRAGKFFKFFQGIVQGECAAFVVGTFYEQPVLVHN